MTPEILFNIVNTGIAPLVKFFLLILIFLYGIFAAVIVRQVQLMNNVVNEVNFSTVLLVLALIHLMATIVLFFITLVVL